MKWSNLTGVKLNFANLTGTNLTGTIFFKTTIPDRTKKTIQVVRI